MKKRMNTYKEFFLLLLIIMIFTSCNWKSINMTDREELLKARVQEMCNLIERGKFKQTRKYLLPQWQSKPEQEYKGDLSSIPEIKGIFDYYKIKSIKFRDNEIAEVLIDSSVKKERDMTYDYWIFVKDNWYIVDYSRTDSVSSAVLEKYKKLIKDNENKKEIREHLTSFFKIDL